MLIDPIPTPPLANMTRSLDLVSGQCCPLDSQTPSPPHSSVFMTTLAASQGLCHGKLVVAARGMVWYRGRGWAVAREGGLGCAGSGRSSGTYEWSYKVLYPSVDTYK